MMILLKESSPTQDTVVRFKIKFLEQFSESLVKTEFISFYMKISELKQNKNEFLLIYYKKIVIMMKKMNARDQERSVLSDQSMSNSLNNLESAMLNIILETFIQEIADKEIKQTVIKHIMIVNRLLLRVYTVIKKTYGTKTRMIKFRKKKRKI